MTAATATAVPARRNMNQKLHEPHFCDAPRLGKETSVVVASYGLMMRRAIFPKVNRAIRRAVRASGPDAHVVDAWGASTPGGRYRRTMLWHGMRVNVRHPDGIHLVPAGAAIVAERIVKAMLRDGVIPSAVR